MNLVSRVEVAQLAIMLCPITEALLLLPLDVIEKPQLVICVKTVPPDAVPKNTKHRDRPVAAPVAVGCHQERLADAAEIARGYSPELSPEIAEHRLNFFLILPPDPGDDARARTTMLKHRGVLEVAAVDVVHLCPAEGDWEDPCNTPVDHASKTAGDLGLPSHHL